MLNAAKMEKTMVREKMRGRTCDQRVLRRAPCVSCTGVLLSARRSRATTSQMTTHSAPMPPSNAKAERHPTATIMKVSNGAKTTGPIELPKVITPRPNARRSGGSQDFFRANHVGPRGHQYRRERKEPEEAATYQVILDGTQVQFFDDRDRRQAKYHFVGEVDDPKSEEESDHHPPER